MDNKTTFYLISATLILFFFVINFFFFNNDSYKINKEKSINIFWLECFHLIKMLEESENEFLYKFKNIIISFKEYEVREMLDFHFNKRQILNDVDLKNNILNIVQNLESSYDEYFENRYKKFQ